MQKYAKQDWVGEGVPLNLLRSYKIGTGVTIAITTQN